jgi:hypothetical protein
MSQLRIVTGRAFATLWVTALGFLALAQPAHALFGSPTVALIAQVVGAVLLGGLFELRGTIRQQCERLSAFLVRSRGLRAVVRTLAVSTIAGPSAEAGRGRCDERGACGGLDAQPHRAVAVAETGCG